MAVSGSKGQEVTPVTSAGADASDPATDSIRVNVVAGGGAGGGTSSAFGSPFPASGTAAGVKDAAGNMAALNLDVSGNLKVASSGGGGGGPATIADGADVAEGATTDAAVTTDINATVSGKLRGLVKIFADVWDSINHWLKVSVQNFPSGFNVNNSPTIKISQAGTDNDVDANITNASIAITGTLTGITNVVHVDDNGGSLTVDGSVTANAGTNLNTSLLALEAGHLSTIDSHTPAQGQATMANSSPVVIASDQSAFPVTANAGTNLNTSALALEATQLTGNTSLASIKTNTDPLVAAGAGGYVRQDSTATIAKETGGNLAAIKLDVDKIPSQGAALTAASMPVNIASDQTVPVSAASLPLPTNAAKEASGNLEKMYNNDVGSVLPTLQKILIELKVMSTVLALGLNVKDDIEVLRAEESRDFNREI